MPLTKASSKPSLYRVLRTGLRLHMSVKSSAKSRKRAMDIARPAGWPDELFVSPNSRRRSLNRRGLRNKFQRPRFFSSSSRTYCFRRREWPRPENDRVGSSQSQAAREGGGADQKARLRQGQMKRSPRTRARSSQPTRGGGSSGSHRAPVLRNGRRWRAGSEHGTLTPEVPNSPCSSRAAVHSTCKYIVGWSGKQWEPAIPRSQQGPSRDVVAHLSEARSWKRPRVASWIMDFPRDAPSLCSLFFFPFSGLLCRPLGLP